MSKGTVVTPSGAIILPLTINGELHQFEVHEGWICVWTAADGDYSQVYDDEYLADVLTGLRQGSAHIAALEHLERARLSLREVVALWPDAPIAVKRLIISIDGDITGALAELEVAA